MTNEQECIRKLSVRFRVVQSAPLRRAYVGMLVDPLSAFRFCVCTGDPLMYRNAIYAHVRWADDAWVNSVTGMDVPAPKLCDVWACDLVQVSIGTWIATPVEYVDYSQVVVHAERIKRELRKLDAHIG